MTTREKVKIPKRFIEKYGDDLKIWSFSKINTYRQCIYEYYLSRIKKVEGKDNIYTACGAVTHSIIEDFYNGKIKYEEMADKFDSEFLDIEVSDYRFSSDEEKNDRMRKKYKECVKHFFKTHNAITTKVLLEQLIWIDIGEGNLFYGYTDLITKDKEGNYHVIDWKTSTVYTGKKIKENAHQLQLYALGLHQLGVPIEKIKAAWNFIKYVNISYKQKNGKIKTTRAERNNWVKKIKTPLKRDIIQFYNCEGWEADLKVEECIKNNSLDNLDKEIQDRYILNDCYVYVDISENDFENLKKEFKYVINEINKRGENEENWLREEIKPEEEYYCSVLCSVSSHCPYYKKMLELKGIKEKEEDELLKLLEEELPF